MINNPNKNQANFLAVFIVLRIFLRIPKALDILGNWLYGTLVSWAYSSAARSEIRWFTILTALYQNDIGSFSIFSPSGNRRN